MEDAMKDALEDIMIGLEKDGYVGENENRCGFDHHRCYEKICKHCFEDEDK